MAALLHNSEHPIGSDPVQLFNYAEAARALGRSTSWLQKQVALNNVPHRRLGRSVAFTPDDLRAIVERSYKAPRGDVA